jgi:hypothetical protein
MTVPAKARGFDTACGGHLSHAAIDLTVLVGADDHGDAELDSWGSGMCGLPATAGDISCGEALSPRGARPRLS